MTARIFVGVTGHRVTLAGRLDETATFAELLAGEPAGPLVLDTHGITFVNSVGMREWIRLLRVLVARGARGEVTLERVADVLLAQMNLIPELRRLGAIASFHAPYACPACGAEMSPLIEVAQHAAELAAGRAPKLPCRECGAAMDLADFPERYLSIFAASAA